ncbi:MAG: mandelate racemase/muconate lactonizing enzyme family protein [Chloroflexi bacterium]|nr:mandelate racemase/muconate lactonizing enzyme family protein [Chloroflexota bacterium]
MKIARIEAFLCDAGWRPWIFVKVETDDGLVGWGECSDARTPYGIAALIRDYEPVLIGQDPRQVERLFWDMYRVSRQNLGGVSHKAIAGIELALWDIKARALGISVSELFGGPLRDRVQVYWSHCGTTRARHAEMLGVPPLRSYDDIYALGKEVVAKGFTALKTNIVVPGEPADVYHGGFDASVGGMDGVVTPEILSRIERLLGTFREAVGPEVGLALDLNYNFRTDGAQQICKLVEPLNLQWIEYDNWDPVALRQIKDSTSTRIASCESLVTTKQYRPFLELHAMDVCIIDLPWNGWIQAKRVADMAEAYETNIAPHNYYSHLSTFISTQFCATLPNVRIMEIDIDDVPWKDALVSTPPTIESGHVLVPSGPGWGATINEDVLREHPWPPRH